jgi:hypothetical protein
MPRLKTRRRGDGLPIIAMPTVEAPETLDGMVVPVDPDRIRKLPRISRAADIALTVALTGLVLLGRRSCAASDLARVCGLPVADLGTALLRAQGRKADGTPKFFRTDLGADGVVTVEAVAKRITRPERYVRLSVEALAAAPDAAHARFYAVATEATIGDETQGKNIASIPASALGLDRCLDQDAALRDMVNWVLPKFFTGGVGRIISGSFQDGVVLLISRSTANWHYDHQAAPRPWTDDQFWEVSRLRERDGKWEGRDLSLDSVRAAKVCDWVRKRCCDLGAGEIRILWLYALRELLAGRDVGPANRQILRAIREHGVDTAFERWVIANAASFTRPYPHIRKMGEEACALRRIAAADPNARGLGPYATDPLTGESLCYLQYRWRVVEPIEAEYQAGNWSRWEYEEALARQLVYYQVDGRKPPVRPTPKPPPLAWQRLTAMGVWIIRHQFDRPEHWGAAFDLAHSAVVCGDAVQGRYESIEEYLEAILEKATESADPAPLRRRWRAGLGVAESGTVGEPVRPGTVEEAARQLLDEALEATA